MRSGLLPAAAVLPPVRERRRGGVPRLGSRDAAQLRDQPPRRAGLHCSLRDRGGGARRRPTAAHEPRRRGARSRRAPTRPARRGGLRDRRRDGGAALPFESVVSGSGIAIVGAAETAEIGTVAASSLALA